MKIPDTRSFVLCALLGASLVLPAGAIAQSDTESGFPGDSNPFVRKTRTDSLDAIFNPATLGETTLEFTLDEWNKLLGYYDRNPRNETEVSGTYSFVKDGRVWRFEQTGIRLRGNTSRRRPEGSEGQPHNPASPAWHQAHFKADFEEMLGEDADRKMSGAMDGVILKWFKDDANHVREIYCYNLFRSFGVWTAPRAAYTSLSLKVGGASARYGVYAMVEDIDKQFIKARKGDGLFKSDKGDLWKCTWASGDGAPLTGDSLYSVGVEEISLNEYESRRFNYDLKTNKGDLAAATERLKAFVGELEALQKKKPADVKAWFEEHTDAELLIRTLAVNVACGMWDDYWSNKNNYYIYFDSDGKFYVLPYDYDNTLGVSLGNFGDAGTKNPLKWGPSSDRPLVNALLSVPEYRDRYIACLKELADPKKDLFNADASRKRIETWHRLIRGRIANDTDGLQALDDYPADWGSTPFYRLLTGDDKTNFFRAKAKAIQKLK